MPEATNPISSPDLNSQLRMFLDPQHKGYQRVDVFERTTDPDTGENYRIVGSSLVPDDLNCIYEAVDEILFTTAPDWDYDQMTEGHDPKREARVALETRPESYEPREERPIPRQGSGTHIDFRIQTKIHDDPNNCPGSGWVLSPLGLWVRAPKPSWID